MKEYEKIKKKPPWAYCRNGGFKKSKEISKWCYPAKIRIFHSSFAKIYDNIYTMES